MLRDGRASTACSPVASKHGAGAAAKPPSKQTEKKAAAPKAASAPGASVHIVGGWYDFFLEQQLRDWRFWVISAEVSLALRNLPVLLRAAMPVLMH